MRSYATMLIVFAVSLVLAYRSQRASATTQNGKIHIDPAFVALVILLGLFCGLRTAYNDTGAYIAGFNSAPSLAEYFEGKLNLFGNPLFYLFQSFFRHCISDNYHLFLVVVAFWVTSVFLLTIKRYSENYVFGVFLFFCSGLYVFEFAALKQVIAMSILMLAIPRLIKRKYFTYYIFVFLAMLFHAYAALFIILPFCLGRPWSVLTFASVVAVLFVMATFQSTITHFLELAEAWGKSISEADVFNSEGINIYRLAVYFVPPGISLLGFRRIKPQLTIEKKLLINMSILSFLMMCLGIFSGANFFGRCAIYFEIGTIAVLGWLINRIFNQKSATFVFGVASVCYFVFFMVDIQDFVLGYTGISIWEFIGTMWK